MYRIDDPSATVSRPAPIALGAEGWFLNGVAGGAQGTVVTAEHKNMVQAEMEALRALNPTDPGSLKTDDTQLAAAIVEYVNSRLPNGSPEGLTHFGVGATPTSVTSRPGACRSESGAWGMEDATGQTRSITTAFTTAGPGGLASSVPNTVGVPTNAGWLSYHALWTKAGDIAYGWDTAASYKSAAGLRTDAGVGWDYHRRLGWHYFAKLTASPTNALLDFGDTADTIRPYVMRPEQPHEVRHHVASRDFDTINWLQDADELRTANAPPWTLAHQVHQYTDVDASGHNWTTIITPLDIPAINPDSNNSTYQIRGEAGEAQYQAFSFTIWVNAVSQYRQRFSFPNPITTGPNVFTGIMQGGSPGYQDWRVALT